MSPSNTKKPLACVIRLTAIGDTLIAIRAARTLFDAGHRVLFVTSTAHRAVMEAQPFLTDFALFGEDKLLKFFSRTEGSMQTWLEKEPREFWNDFGQAQLTQGSVFALPVFDLQRTGRSRRCVKALKIHCAASGLKNVDVHTVRKRTLFRVLLLVLTFFSFSQRKRTGNGSWQKRVLTRVHSLQAELVNSYLQRKDGSHSVPQAVLPAGGHEHTLASTPLLAPESHTTRPAILAGRRYVVFFPGASGPLKAWPKEHFRKCIELLLEQTEFDAVLCGGKSEQDVGHYLDFPARTRVVNLIGRCSLAETLAVIADAHHVITGDSFATHAADLLSVPASVIFGGTSPHFGFVPISQKIRLHYADLACSPCTRHGKGECRFRNLRCLTDIRPEEVMSDIPLPSG